MCVMGRVPQLMSVWRQPWVSAGICFVCYRCDGLRWVTWGRRTGVQGDGRPLGVRACCCLGWDCLGRLSSCCILLSVFRSRVVIMEWTFRSCLPFGHVSMFWRCLLEVRREQPTWSTLGGCDGKDCEFEKPTAQWEMFLFKDKLRTRINGIEMRRPQSDRDLSGAMFWSSLGAGVMTLTGVWGA